VGKAQVQKTGDANFEALQRFQGPDAKDKIKYVWSDTTPEIMSAIQQLGVRGDHDNSIPGGSQGNGLAENNDRDIKMGAASLLAHAGLPLACWPIAMPCYWIGQGAAISHSTSPYCERFSDNSDQSKMFPCGAEVLFIPSKITGGPTLHFDTTTRPGTFVGFVGHSGCVWNGAYFVARMKEFARVNYHTGRAKITNKVTVARMVRDVQRVDAAKDAKFNFPLGEHYDKVFNTLDGWLDSSWRDQPTVYLAAMSDESPDRRRDEDVPAADVDASAPVSRESCQTMQALRAIAAPRWTDARESSTETVRMRNVQPRRRPLTPRPHNAAQRRTPSEVPAAHASLASSSTGPMDTVQPDVQDSGRASSHLGGSEIPARTSASQDNRPPLQAPNLVPQQPAYPPPLQAPNLVPRQPAYPPSPQDYRRTEEQRAASWVSAAARAADRSSRMTDVRSNRMTSSVE
jgi:hypothetical protein